MASLAELLEQQKQIALAIERARAEEKGGGLKQIVSIMRNLDLSIEDVSRAFGRRVDSVAVQADRHAPASGRSKVAAKYRDQATGDTWSGRGLQPRWLKERLSAGKTLGDFKV
jgi:DNA-binding protein H-NS